MGWKNLIFEFETVVKIFVISIESCKYFIFPFQTILFVCFCYYRRNSRASSDLQISFYEVRQITAAVCCCLRNISTSTLSYTRKLLCWRKGKVCFTNNQKVDQQWFMWNVYICTIHTHIYLCIYNIWNVYVLVGAESPNHRQKL